jgi:serine/threonine-protein kinase RsbW
MAERLIFEIKFPNRQDLLEIPEMLLRYFLEEFDIDVEDKSDIIVASREGILNAIIHGNKQNPERFVTVKLSTEKNKLKVNIIDEGRGFDPSIIDNLMEHKDVFSLPSKGIILMKALMDKVNYTNLDHPRGFKLELIKNITLEK